MTSRAQEAYGQRGLTWVDRFGVWLSQRAIRRHLPPGNALDVLELGCGYRAAQLLALRDRLRAGTGVDFAIAPEIRMEPRLSLLECPIDAALSQLAGRTFDMVLLISVLEHLADAAGTLRSVYPLVRPGGVLLVNVPTWRGKTLLEFSAFRLGLSPKLEMDDHKMYYNKRDLWPLLVRAGFRPSEIRLSYHKFGLNLFAVARALPPDPA